MSHTFHHQLKRRQILQVGATSATALWLGSALAQQQRVVVGTWGGDYGKLLTKNVEDPFLKPKGIEA